MEKNLEQRYAIKFCVKLGKTATETLGMIRDAYGDAAISRSTVFEWHKLFREGRELHHDNAPCHTALLVREFLAKHRVTTLPHPPPYSPDMAPPDFFLFPRLKRDLKGNRYSSVEDVQGAVTASLKGIPESEFQKAYAQWESRYTRCVEAKGCYFEDY